MCPPITETSCAGRPSARFAPRWSGCAGRDAARAQCVGDVPQDATLLVVDALIEASRGDGQQHASTAAAKPPAPGRGTRANRRAGTADAQARRRADGRPPWATGRPRRRMTRVRAMSAAGPRWAVTQPIARGRPATSKTSSGCRSKRQRTSPSGRRSATTVHPCICPTVVRRARNTATTRAAGHIGTEVPIGPSLHCYLP